MENNNIASSYYSFCHKKTINLFHNKNKTTNLYYYHPTSLYLSIENGIYVGAHDRIPTGRITMASLGLERRGRTEASTSEAPSCTSPFVPASPPATTGRSPARTRSHRCRRRPGNPTAWCYRCLQGLTRIPGGRGGRP
jgi:hypothetical protein